jgi:hypothetical protein
VRPSVASHSSVPAMFRQVTGEPLGILAGAGGCPPPLQKPLVPWPPEASGTRCEPSAVQHAGPAAPQCPALRGEPWAAKATAATGLAISGDGTPPPRVHLV